MGAERMTGRRTAGVPGRRARDLQQVDRGAAGRYRVDWRRLWREGRTFAAGAKHARALPAPRPPAGELTAGGGGRRADSAGASRRAGAGKRGHADPGSRSWDGGSKGRGRRRGCTKGEVGELIESDMGGRLALDPLVDIRGRDGQDGCERRAASARFLLSLLLSSRPLPPRPRSPPSRPTSTWREPAA